MLRSVRIKNFIHFKKEQRVDFVKGSQFFIGPNNSGKTSVFEAIRRCLSISMNTSLSSSHDPQEESVVICIYDDVQDITEERGVHTSCEMGDSITIRPRHGKDGTYDVIYKHGEKETETGGVQDYKQQTEGSASGQHTIDCIETKREIYEKLQGKVFTSIICLKKKDAEAVAVYVKTAFYFGKSVCKVGMEFIKQNRHKYLVNECINFFLTEDWYVLLVRLVEPKATTTLTDDFIKHILDQDLDQRRNTFADKDLLADKETPCNKILREYLDDHVVFTFPMRSIGSLQWSFSERVTHQTENYHNAQKCAEIVAWYLNRCEKHKDNNTNVRETEKLYFNRITNSSGFEFVRDNGNELKVYRTSRKENEEIPILKVPEGILEAKSCSILLASDCFKTIGLEDPERGMHPQMVERLRDLVLWEIKDKVVFVTSHHPSFLAPWAISRICFFRYNDQKDTFRIISGTKIIEPLLDEQLPAKNDGNPAETNAVQRGTVNTIPNTLRIITSYHFSSIFFAERVMLVEGETEVLFMNTLRFFLMKDDEFVSTLADVDKTMNFQMETFRQFMSSLQMMHLGGEGNKQKFENLCKQLKIERYFLLDKDAIEKKMDEKLDFATKFNLKYTQEEIVEDIAKLENEGIFVWKHGNIEKEIIDFSNNHYIDGHETNTCGIKHEDMKTCLKENKVAVDNKSNNKITKIQGKLFHNKGITDDNVKQIVKNILVISKVEQKSEFRRFVKFLYRTGVSGDRCGCRFNRQR